MLPNAVRSAVLVRGLLPGTSATAVRTVASVVRVVVSASDSSSTLYADDNLASRLGDKDLLRVQGYIGGRWRDASDNGALDVRCNHF